MVEMLDAMAAELGFAIRRIDSWKDPRWKDEIRAAVELATVRVIRFQAAALHSSE